MLSMHRGVCYFSCRLVVTASNAYHCCPLLTLYTHTSHSNKGLDNIGNDKLKKMRRHISNRLTTKHSKSARLGNCGNERMSIDSFPFNCDEKIPRTYLAAIVLGRAKVDIRIWGNITPQENLAIITLHDIPERKHICFFLSFIFFLYFSKLFLDLFLKKCLYHRKIGSFANQFMLRHNTVQRQPTNASSQMVWNCSCKCILKIRFINIPARNNSECLLILTCLRIIQCSRQSCSSSSFCTYSIIFPEQANCIVNLLIGDQENLEILRLLRSLKGNGPDFSNQ